MALAFVVALAACDRDAVIATGAGDAGAAIPGAVDAAITDAGSDFCSGAGPIVEVGDGVSTCGGKVAASAFRFALCSCQDYAGAARLDTDSFDSRRGAYQPGGRGGSIGVNGRFTSQAPVRAGGALWSAELQAGAGAPITIASDLRAGGPVACDAALEVGRDARVAGGLRAASLTVTGTLTLPPGAPLDIAGARSVGSIVRAPVSVPPPCACGAEILDVAALVRRHRDANDDAQAGVDPGALAERNGPRTLALPCGRYYFDRVSGSGPLTLAITGRAAVFVDGDLALDDALTITVGDGAELDLFVAGNIVSPAALVIGGARSPARTRVYVGGSGTLQLSGGAIIGGNLYAPRAELTTSGPIEVFGSLFVRRVAASAPVTVHYDSAVLAGGGDCAEPELPNACPTACATHADCCAPLFCVSGTCSADPF